MYNMDDLADRILADYENTDAAQLTNPNLRYDRITDFMQRALDAIWYDRTWPFTMTSSSITMSGGSASRPADFAGLTGDGGMWDSTGVPWREIAYQDMSVIRSRGVEQSSKLFSIGATVLIPDTSGTGTYTLVYQKTAPELSVYGSSQAMPLPYPFWEALLLGTVVRLKQEVGDDRPQWRSDYVSALVKQQRLWRERASRPRMMPLTIGGQW